MDGTGLCPGWPTWQCGGQHEAFDANRLSQMFNAKILSLYFPNRFLAVCSKEALEVLAGETGPDGDLRWGLA